jgi:hypothetical protein
VEDELGGRLRERVEQPQHADVALLLVKPLKRFKERFVNYLFCFVCIFFLSKAIFNDNFSCTKCFGDLKDVSKIYFILEIVVAQKKQQLY